MPHRDRVYHGTRRPDGRTIVTVDGRLLEPRLDLRSHSDQGVLEWGFGEGGASQLALAILADYLGDDDRALELYHEFRHVVWQLPSTEWRLDGAAIDKAVEKIERLLAERRSVAVARSRMDEEGED